MDRQKFKERLYLSTVSEDAVPAAKRYGLGLEIAEFCTAMNMDMDFPRWDALVRSKMAVSGRFVFHAPFNELCPAAIDPLVLEIAVRRYEQAWALAKTYGAKRMVVHSGYVPLVYFPEYFIERSAAFWTDFLKDKERDMVLLLENVLEDTPDMLFEIVRQVGDPRLRLCLDTGHANVMKKGVTLETWLEKWLPYLGHLHLHNNDGSWDYHKPLGEGTIDMEAFLRRLSEASSDATMTIEAQGSERSVRWLIEKGFIEE